jgi:hypothetical protein
MDAQWYVRIRGQILGPFSTEKLQELACRGEFTRIHEVSPDGMNWERASNHPEFFPLPFIPKRAVGTLPEKVPTTDSPAPGPSGTTEPQPASLVPSAPTPLEKTGGPPVGISPSTADEWYYLRDGASVGPVSETELRRMLDAGRLPPNVIVWNKRLPAWCPADQVLPPHAPQTSPFPFRADRSPAEETLPENLCHAALRIRPWTLFLVVMYWISAFLFLVSGVILIAIGAHQRMADSTAMIFGGIGALIFAIVWGLYALTLYNYTASLKNLLYNRSPVIFQKSLYELYYYFLVKGIVYIVGLILIGLFALVVMIRIASGVAAYSW